jgi:hypothetical protein
MVVAAVLKADLIWPKWAQVDLVPIYLLGVVPAPTLSPDPSGIFTLHEGIWGIYPGHGGGGCLLRRRWSTSFVWLDCWIS